MNCGVVEWVDRPWPIIMPRCLLKLWGMLDESNDDRQAKDEEISRLKMDIEQVNLKLENLVAAVERTNVTTMKIDRQKKQMGILIKTSSAFRGLSQVPFIILRTTRVILS